MIATGRLPDTAYCLRAHTATTMIPILGEIGGPTRLALIYLPRLFPFPARMRECQVVSGRSRAQHVLSLRPRAASPSPPAAPASAPARSPDVVLVVVVVLVDVLCQVPDDVGVVE